MFVRFCTFLLCVTCALAASPHKEPITFTITADVGFGKSVFVIGNHPDVGAWDVTQAVKLRYTSGNIWTGQVAIQAGTDLQYKFISRSTRRDPGAIRVMRPTLRR